MIAFGAIGLADVQRVAYETFLPSNRTLGQYVPTATPERAPQPARVDVAAALKDFKGQAGAAAAEAFDASPRQHRRAHAAPEPALGHAGGAAAQVHTWTGCQGVHDLALWRRRPPWPGGARPRQPWRPCSTRARSS